MALPAGRYGVTKNQLLKIKKLPMNTIKLIEELTEKFDLLGSAAFKNSTSVVTQSNDLVESGAVENIIGWGNKNLSVPYTYSTGDSEFSLTYDNNKITVNGTLTSADILQPISSVARNNGYVFDLPAGTYTVSLTGDTANIEPQIVKSNGTVLEGTTVTLDTPTTVFLRVMVKKDNTFNNQICYIQLEKGSTATTYEPYHASVEDSLEEKADNSVIGTVEDGTNPTKSYAVGEHMIRGGKFCTVTSPVTTSSTWTHGSNYVEGTIADLLNVVEGALTVTDSSTFVLNYAKKIHNIVCVAVKKEISYTAGEGAILLGTLPNGFIPNQEFYTVFTDPNGEYMGRIAINTLGKIFARPSVTLTNKTIGFTATYII